jgi:hypothetical protein
MCKFHSNVHSFKKFTAVRFVVGCHQHLARTAGTRFQLSSGLSPAARASSEPAEAAEKLHQLAHPHTHGQIFAPETAAKIHLSHGSRKQETSVIGIGQN